MKNIKVLGIDLAKNVFQIHGADAKGKCVLRKRLSRAKLIEFMANLSPCIIGIEACGGSHYWARLFKQYGHEVRMMAPQFVKPYVKSNKNDRNDSEAIAEACTRPTMRFVAIKTVEQQDILVIHRARELSIKNRTAQASQIRGILSEYGITIPEGISKIRRVTEIIELNKNNVCQEVQKIAGIGPLIASAIVATIGDAKTFKNGREVSAWLGLTPKQFSSG